MRYIWLLLCLLALSGYRLTPHDRLALAATDIVVTYTVSVSGVGGNSDSIVVTTAAAGQPSVTRTYVTPGPVVDSVTFAGARPGINSTITGNVQATAYRRGLAGPTTTQPWSYTEPDVAPPAPGVSAAAHPGA